MNKLSVYLCGQKYFGAEVLTAILDAGHRVAGVSSPAWRNERLPLSDPSPGCGPDRLRSAAERSAIPWRPAGALRASDLPAGVDLIVAAHSHDFIGRPARRAARLGAIGYHPSLLPLHRGRDAVRWAVRMRDRITGGTVFWLSDNVDAGPIAAQDWCFIRPDDTAEELWRRDLAPMGVRLLVEVLGQAAVGRIVAVPQPAELASWEPALDTAPMPRPELPAIGPGVGDTVVTGDADKLARGFGLLRAAMYDEIA